MTARGEEFARRIEESIRQAVERMVTDMRSSIEDVREAVVQQLEAAAQSVQADAKSLSLRGELEGILAELDESAAPPPPAPAPPAADSARLRRALRAVEQGKSQVEVLNALLEQVLSFSSRAALFILKGDGFAGWKGAGFSARGGNDENVKRFAAGPGEVADLGRLLRDEIVVATDGAAIASRLGVAAPARALLVPMVIKDKVAAAMYADVVDGEQAKLDRPAIEILVFTTGLLIDTLSIRKKSPSPSLSADEGDGESTLLMAPSASVPMPQAPAAPAPRPTPPPQAERTVAMPPPRPAEPPRPEPSRPPEPPGPAAPPVRSFELDESDSAPSVSFSTTAIPSPLPPPAPPPPAAAPPRSAGPGGHEGERPSTQYIPPPGVVGGRFGAQQPQTAEAKKHDEAKRFARLLVSEIKLYNEAKVDEGRKHRDLYERMKEDIDRSRQMYEERISEDVRRQSNYFYDELVRILADGDPDLLGL